jgi:nitrite reductase (NADH) large subunit
VKLVVVGNGMVGQRFVETLSARDSDRRWSTTVLAEERRRAYDRVRLSAYFEGVTAEQLTLAPPDVPAGVAFRLGEPALEVDRAARVVRTAAGA